MDKKKNTPTVPWYKHFREYFMMASKYLYASEVSSFKFKAETLSGFENETLAQFLFESNNIEREGLSRGETKDLVIEGLDEFPNLQSVPQDEKMKWVNLSANFKNIVGDVPIDFRVLHEKFPQVQNAEQITDTIDKTRILFLARYGKKSKEALTVTRHLIATVRADGFAIKNFTDRIKYFVYTNAQKNLKSENHEIRKQAQEFLDKVFTEPASKPGPLITEEIIKSLHEDMAEDLVDNGNAPAGNYRTRSIMTDIDSHYPAPEDVPSAMKHFIELYKAKEELFPNPISLAAWASTQFVLIHPFPDFNGRISRLIINMIFRAHGLPFWISLKSSKKERKRYITALRHYKCQRPLSISTLISMRLINEFEELNRIQSLSGYQQIDISQMPDFPSDWSDNDIYNMNWAAFRYN